MHYIIGSIIIIVGIAMLVFTSSFVDAEQNSDRPLKALRQGKEMRRFITVKNKFTSVAFIVLGLAVLILPSL